MVSVDKAGTICVVALLIVAFGIGCMSYYKDIVAIEKGYIEVQKQGTLNTMWVKGACK